MFLVFWHGSLAKPPLCYGNSIQCWLTDGNKWWQPKTTYTERRPWPHHLRSQDQGQAQSADFNTMTPTTMQHIRRPPWWQIRCIICLMFAVMLIVVFQLLIILIDAHLLLYGNVNIRLLLQCVKRQWQRSGYTIFVLTRHDLCIICIINRMISSKCTKCLPLTKKQQLHIHNYTALNFNPHHHVHWFFI